MLADLHCLTVRARQCPTARLSDTKTSSDSCGGCSRLSALWDAPAIPHDPSAQFCDAALPVTSHVMYDSSSRWTHGWIKGAGSDPVREVQDKETVTAVRYSWKVVPVVDVSGVSSSSAVPSCLIWTCLLVPRRSRTWAIRRENSLLFCFPAGKYMYWEKVRILNVLVCLRCAAAFTEVNAKLISTMQRVSCAWLGLHGHHTAGYTKEMRWNVWN